MDDMIDEVFLLAGLLSSATRLAAYRALGERGLAVLEVAAVIGTSASTASYHLALLQEGGLVRVRRQGRRHVYRWATRSGSSAVRRRRK